MKNLNAEKIIAEALKKYGNGRIILASSFSIEDQVLTHMLLKLEPAGRIFTLDTGRHFQETYDVQQRTQEQLNCEFEVYSPDANNLSALLQTNGPNCFYKSIEQRKMCCAVRKVEPLKKVLSTVDAWICGLRQEQSITRTLIEPMEWDEAFGIYKINPLWNWREEQVWDYIKKHNIPFNVLQKQGFRSVGCAPCTRPVKEGEDLRAGRWWWEDPEQKECGLHRASSYTAREGRQK